MVSIKNYNKPTPSKWKKVGDILLVISTVLSGFIANFTEPPYKNFILGAIIVTGVLGKIITDLTAETNED